MVFTFLGMLILVKPQSAKAPAPIISISASSWNFTVVIFLQPLKALSSIFFTDLGKLNDSRLSALAKALDSMVSKSQLPSILKFLSFLFVANAEALIVFSFEPSGIVIFSNFPHSEKAAAISVIEAGKTTSFNSSQARNTSALSSLTLEGAWKLTVTSFFILRKASIPMVSTVLGTTIDVSLFAPWKAFCAISLTVVGILYFAPSLAGG